MKTKKLFFLAFVLFLFFLQACNRAKPITLRVTVSNDVCRSSQWVYWFSLNGNEFNIEDSCFLARGQHSFTMKKVIPDMNEEMGCWLTFTKHGPLQTLLMLNKGEDVKLTINKKGITKTAGSPENKEWYDYMRKMGEIWKKIHSLTVVLESTKDSLTRRHLSDSIHYLKNNKLIKMRIEGFKNIKTPKIFLILINSSNGLPRKTVDSLVTVMKQRFPHNKRVQEYPWHPKFPPPTLHSKEVQKKLLQIWTTRTGISYKRPVTHILSAAQKKAVSRIKPLKPGDKVDSLSFKGLNGKIIALKDIHTPYVLIDFWASWCNPCRAEVPDLKLTQAKYKGRLTIYAVSLDKNKSNWRKAILSDKSNNLTQVIADSSLFTRKKIQKLFGIQYIPANFLLDQHRKIIAVNLRGDALKKKMEELCRK